MPRSSPRVFVSYSHDSPEHVDRVAELARTLRSAGVDAWIDRYEQKPPDDGWPNWMLNQIESAEFILLVCTKDYFLRFRGKTPITESRGVRWEGAIMTAGLYDGSLKKNAIVPVLFSPSDRDFVPEVLRGGDIYFPLESSDRHGLKGLLALLQGNYGIAIPPLAPMSLRLSFQPIEKPRPKGTPIKVATVALLAIFLSLLSPDSTVRKLQVPARLRIDDSLLQEPQNGIGGFLLVPPHHKARLIQVVETNSWAIDRLGNIAASMKSLGTYQPPQETINRYLQEFQKTCLTNPTLFVAWLKIYEHDQAFAQKGLVSLRGDHVSYPGLGEPVVKRELFTYALNFADILHAMTTGQIGSPYSVRFGGDSVNDRVQRQVWTRIAAAQLLEQSSGTPKEFGPYITAQGTDHRELGRTGLPTRNAAAGALTAAFVTLTNAPPSTSDSLLSQIPKEFLPRFLPLMLDPLAKQKVTDWFAQWKAFHARAFPTNLAVMADSEPIAFFEARTTLVNDSDHPRWLRLAINDDVPEDNGDGFATVQIELRSTQWGTQRLRRWLSPATPPSL